MTKHFVFFIFDNYKRDGILEDVFLQRMYLISVQSYQKSLCTNTTGKETNCNLFSKKKSKKVFFHIRVFFFFFWIMYLFSRVKNIELNKKYLSIFIVTDLCFPGLSMQGGE